MATVARPVARAATRITFRNAVSTAPRLGFRQTGRRFYSSSPKPTLLKAGTQSSRSTRTWLVGGGLVGAGIIGYLYTRNGGLTPKVPKLGFQDYQAVYDEIAKRIQDNDEYDDGSYAPVLLRLAWHCSGTYDKETGTGGSNGATMRFAPESDHGANAGLKHARDFLEPVKEKFPWISYSDLWILGGVCAVQEMMGPKVPFRPGRSDRDMAACTPDGRLPDGAKTQKHVRAIFSRMGFDDQEMAALIGAHAVGRCHADRSGFDGPWTFSPTVITNDFYKLLLDGKWEWRKWNGPKQYTDKDTKSLMMLPADMAFVDDKKFKEYIQKYAADNDLWFKDFSGVLVKLFELGVPFTEGSESQRWVFKTLDE